MKNAKLKEKTEKQSDEARHSAEDRHYRACARHMDGVRSVAIWMEVMRRYLPERVEGGERIEDGAYVSVVAESPDGHMWPVPTIGEDAEGGPLWVFVERTTMLASMKRERAEDGAFVDGVLAP